MKRTTIVVERAQLVARTREDGRNVYRKEGKAALVAACAELGASVAAIALAHGVNANLLRKWITRSHTRDRAHPDQRTEALAAGNAAARSPASRGPLVFGAITSGVGDQALAWGWSAKCLIELAFLFVFSCLFCGVSVVLHSVCHLSGG